MLYKLFLIYYLFFGNNINAFRFGNFKGNTKRFASNLFYPNNDMHKNYLAFVPRLIDDDDCSETLSILVYRVIDRAKHDKVIYVDSLILSPYWEENQITLNSIKNAYCRYFKERLNIKYVYLL